MSVIPPSGEDRCWCDTQIDPQSVASGCGYAHHELHFHGARYAALWVHSRPEHNRLCRAPVRAEDPI